MLNLIQSGAKLSYSFKSDLKLVSKVTPKNMIPQVFFSYSGRVRGG